MSSTIAANVAAPGAAIHDHGGDVINLATSTPVNGCNRTAARSARSRERRGLRAGQEPGEALSKIQRSPLAETARLACAHGLPLKPRACRSTEHDDGRSLHGDREELGCGSELGRQVAVDLEADADLDKDRGLPRHDTLHEIL
jgi:hypothetical protein